MIIMAPKSVITRRNACKLLGLGIQALSSSAEERHMFPALNSVLLSGRVHWPDFARLAAQTGFPGTDVMLAAAMKEGAPATVELFRSLKLRPAALDFPVDFRTTDANFDASLAKLEPAAAFASAIGCPRMVTYILPSSDTPKEQLLPVFRERFVRSAKILAQHDVRLGLEFLGPLHLRKAKPHEFIWRMNDMLAFAKECGPNVGLLLDVWHWHHAGGTTADIVAAGRSRVVHVHFNDAPNLPPEEIRDDHRLLPGEGVIDLVGFLKALRTIGYDDALSVEVFGRLKDETPERAAQLGLEATRKVFAKAGIPV